MNMLKKSIALFIAIVLVIAAIPAALAADGQPGKTVTVSLNLGTGYGIDGSITVSDPDGIISNVTFTGPSNFDGFIEPSGNGYYAYFSKDNVSSAGDCIITATVTLKNDESLVGKSATISFSGTTSQADNGNFTDVGASVSVTVTMVEPVVEVKIDYTELLKQIGIAEGLNKGDYTAESWQALEDALANGKNHLNSKNQAAVDQAAKELADAIAALVKMDYSKLEQAIQNGNDLISDDELGKLWKELMDAIAEGNGLLGSGDQAAVDAAADNILRIIAELKKAIEDANKQQGTQQIITVPGTCDHEGPFCNIDIHKLWPILFIISLIGNIVLVIVIFYRKKKEAETNGYCYNEGYKKGRKDSET